MDPPSGLLKPPRMTNKQALDLRKQAVLGQAASHQSHHLQAVQEDAMDSSVEECSKLSLASSSNESDHPAAGLRHKVALGSWEAYWDTRQTVEVPGRCADELALQGLSTGLSAVQPKGCIPAIVSCLRPPVRL